MTVTATAQIKAAMAKMNASDEGWFAYAPIVWDALTSSEREQLNQLLHQGPVYDGNVLSKAARSNLIDYGLAARCCYKGEQGYTAATYAAYTVFRSSKAVPMKRHYVANAPTEIRPPSKAIRLPVFAMPLL
jgi:hypothetical protein